MCIKFAHSWGYVTIFKGWVLAINIKMGVLYTVVVYIHVYIVYNSGVSKIFHIGTGFHKVIFGAPKTHLHCEHKVEIMKNLHFFYKNCFHVDGSQE